MFQNLLDVSLTALPHSLGEPLCRRRSRQAFKHLQHTVFDSTIGPRRVCSTTWRVLPCSGRLSLRRWVRNTLINWSDGFDLSFVCGEIYIHEGTKMMTLPGERDRLMKRDKSIEINA